MSEATVVIRKAIPSDAPELLRVLQILNSETDFLVMDELGLNMETDAMAGNLAQMYESPNNLLLVALLDGMIVGVASVMASAEPSAAHIGEIGISLLKEYWGFGLGSFMMEEILIWAVTTGVIRRLELTVQARNERACRLYEKFDFQTEAVMARGVKSAQGAFLDVYLMSRMIDPE